MNTGPSKLLPCPKCGKEVRARGMDAHLRLMHGKRVHEYKAQERPTQLELGLNEVPKAKVRLNGVKRRKKGSSYNSQEGSELVKTLIVGLGLAWLVHEVAKNIQETAGKEKKRFPGNGQNGNIVLR